MTLFAIVSAASAVAAGPFDIAVRGRTPDCAIVRAADASPAVVYAAEELRDFTERMTGVSLPVVEVGGAAKPVIPRKAVFLNCSRRLAKMRHSAGLGDDGFRLKVNGDDLSIVGGGPRGVLYGVYELLERFGGCRWYAFWHTVVPRLDAFSVPDSLADEQKPAFLCRDDHWRDYFWIGVGSFEKKAGAAVESVWLDELVLEERTTPLFAGDEGHKTRGDPSTGRE